MPEPEAPPSETDTRGNERPTPEAGANADSEPATSTRDASKASHDESRASQGTTQAKRRSSKQKQIETLDEFVQYAYSRSGQRLTLTKKVARLLNEGPSISDDVLDRVAKLAETDVLFAVPRQILLAGLPHRSVSRLWARLQSVVNRAIDVHPCTRGLVVRPEEEKNADLDIDSAAGEALRRDCSQIRHPRTGKALTKTQVKTLRMNVAYTLALWMVARHRLDWRSVVRQLHAWIWEGEGDRVRSDTDRLRAVTDVRQGNTAGLLCKAFVDEANEQRARAEAAQRREEAARLRIEELQEQIAAKNASLSAHQEQIARLERDMSQAIAKHEAEVVHLRDDYERLRTRVLRRLKSELELLDEGLHAIRRTPPKVAVMEDHADRAVGGLRDEINALEAEARE